MLNVSAHVRIFIVLGATDLRKGFDGLMRLVSDVVKQDALSGHLFVFVNRRKDRVKLMYWDRDGLCIWYKRLETGTFQMPRANDKQRSLELEPAQLSMILGGLDIRSARKRKRYRKAS